MTTQSTTQPQLSVNLDLVGAIFTWISENPGDTPTEGTFQHEYVHDDVPAHIAAFIGTGDVSAGGSNLTAQEREPTTNSEWSELVRFTPWEVRPDVVEAAKKIAKTTWRAVCAGLSLDRALEYILNSAQGWDEGSPITWSVKRLIKLILDNL